jgi:ubiquinone/menaquinone biosynthesis C-methylase UbiE
MFHPNGPTLFELAVQALSSTRHGYDLLAPKFDYTPFRTPQPILDAVASRLAPRGPFGRGLDLCCGTGAGLDMLRPLCRDAVIGLDFSEGMLAIARQRSEVAGSAHLNFVRADALALPFTTSFDVVTCFGALGHILQRDEPRFVAEVARVLRPGGCFAFVTSYLPSAWSTRYWVARLFNGAMRVRNWLITPPFIMYYLTFLLPGVEHVLRAQRFSVEVHNLPLPPGLDQLRLVLGVAPQC